MQNMQAIQVHLVEFDHDLAAIKHNVACRLALMPRKTYLHYIRHFARWMPVQMLSFQVLSRNDLVAFRAYLRETCAKATASRMWAVAEQGHHVAIIQHGKGNRQRLAKLPVELKHAIDTYLEAVENIKARPEAPLFVGFRKGDHPQEMPNSRTLIERVVKQRAKAIGMTMSPYDMRAGFITLAFCSKSC